MTLVTFSLVNNSDRPSVVKSGFIINKEKKPSEIILTRIN